MVQYLGIAADEPLRIARHINRPGIILPLIQTVAGMPVNEVIGLVKAKQEGRIIVPPCKVGDTVYSTKTDMRFDAVITEISITDTDVFFEWVQYDKSYEITEVWDEGYFVLEDFGKTVFLTREEAEQALKGSADYCPVTEYHEVCKFAEGVTENDTNGQVHRLRNTTQDA